MNQNSITRRLVWTGGWLVGHIVAALAVLISLVKVVPIFVKVFSDFEMALPSLTQKVILLSRQMTFYGRLALAVGVVLDTAMLFGLRCLPPGGRWLSRLWAACFLVAAVCSLGAILLAIGLPMISLQHVLSRASVR